MLESRGGIDEGPTKDPGRARKTALDARTRPGRDGETGAMMKIGPAVLLLGVWALSGWTEARPVNLLLITIDTLRADRVGAWGYSPAHTPNLD